MSENRKENTVSEQDIGKIFMTVGICVILLSVLLIAIILIARNVGGEAPSEGSDAVTTTDSYREPAELPLLSIESIMKEGEAIGVYTSYCNLKFPEQYADIIKVEAVNEGDYRALDFYIELDGAKETIYTILFGGGEGIEVCNLSLEGASEPLRVGVIFYEPQGSYAEDRLSVYYSAADTFNEVASSLEDNKEIQ